MSYYGVQIELRCGDGNCTWAEVCDRGAVVRWLRSLRKLRYRSDAEDEILVELLRSAAPALDCPECGRQGLLAIEVDDAADWPEQRTCDVCNKPIPPERMEALPDATLCAACQQNEESGRPHPQTEYCPKCGSPMQLTLSKSAGLSRYVMRCTGQPPCRR